MKFLAGTTTLSRGLVPIMLLGVGIVGAAETYARADDVTMIPLEHFGQNTRLGIRVGVNGAAPRLYMFDTGSDQFNAQIDPHTAVTTVGEPKFYGYGDGSYGSLIQQIQVNSISYYSKDIQKIILETPATFDVGNTIDRAYTIDSVQLKLDPSIRLSDTPVKDSNGHDILVRVGNQDKQIFVDLNAREKANAGQPAESDGSFGTFGAGDFLSNSSGKLSAIGGLTKSGYIVAANANLDGSATPGCAPCAIVNLNPYLRAQFATFIPWQANHGENYYPQFPGKGGNASTQYEGNYTYTFKFAVDGVQKTVAITGPVLFDTGVSNEVFLQLKGAIKTLENAGLVLKENNDSDKYNGNIDSFSIQKAGDDNSKVDFRQIKISLQSKETAGDGIIVGLPFFHRNSVMYDLENQATAYTPYFVSANNFTTGTPAAGELQLSRVSADMGNKGLLGIAGVVSGSGSLTLDPNTNVRMTNINTYTGATYIHQDALLDLAGFGSIERSQKVIADGTFSIFSHGNGDASWRIPDSANDARIRSLSGSGEVQLGARNLFLTAANDVFSGTINDLDGNKNHSGGGLSVIGGVQTLSGTANYTGLTMVGPGAGLLITQNGLIVSDVTASGFLGNDGHINGAAQATNGGVVAGSGEYGAITVGNGGTISPGSALNSNKIIAKLTVNGDFVQQANSIYRADLASTSDLIGVGQRADIDNNAQIELIRQGIGSVGVRHTLLTAAGGVNGTYAGLTGTLAKNSPFVDFTLAYDPQNVFLDVKRSSTAFASVATTFNQRSIATASDALGSGKPIHDGMLFLNAQESRNAFDLLSGEIHASVHSAFLEDSHFVRDAATDRVRAAFGAVGASSVPIMAYGPGGPEAAPATHDGFAVWGRGFGAWGHLNGDGNAARLNTSSGGYLAGGDALIGDQWRLGMLAGYSHTSFDVNRRLSSGASDNYHLGFYTGAQQGHLGFRSGLAYTWHRVDTNRSVEFPYFSDHLSSKYDAGTFQAFGELGYRLEIPSVSFEPYANLAYVRFHADGFTENGGASALTGRGQSSEATFTTLGLRGSTDFVLGSMNTTIQGGLGWRHAFGDVRPEVGLSIAGGSTFTIAGAPIGENAALLEAGLDARLSENTTLGLSYQGQLASDAQEHGFNAKLAVRF